MMDLFHKQVSHLVTCKLSDNQFSVIVSIAFDMGLESFKESRFLNLVNNNPNSIEVGIEILLLNKVNGTVKEWLTEKRKQEFTLYYKI